MSIQNKPENIQTTKSEEGNAPNNVNLEIKNNINKLYEKINKYFTSNIYFETCKVKNPNPLGERLLSHELDSKEIIEAGLNPGILTMEASFKNAKAIGIDSSPLKVVVAENLKHIEYDKYSLMSHYDDLELPIENLHNCKFRVMNIIDLEFNDNSLDMVFSDGAIKEGEISSFLLEYKRVLKPQGILLLKFELNDQLKILTEDPKKGTIECPLSYNNLLSWATLNNMSVTFDKIIYKIDLFNTLININPKLIKLPIFIKHEKEVIIELQKQGS